VLDRQAIWEGKPQSLFFIQYLAIASAAAASGAMAQGAVFGADTVVLTTIHVGMVLVLG